MTLVVDNVEAKTELLLGIRGLWDTFVKFMIDVLPFVAIV